MPDCPPWSSGLEEMVLPAFYYCERVNPYWSHIGEWTARISLKQLVLLNVVYVVDNIDLLYQDEKRVVFLAILAVARMVIWGTWNMGFYDSANFFQRDLILFFRHQLGVKIRCERKMQGAWAYERGETLQPPLSAHGDDGPGPSGPHPQ